MPHRVLPARRGVLKVGEVSQYPVVDILDGQFLDGRVLDGHEDEAAEGVGRLTVDVLLRVVGHVGRVGRRVARVLRVVVLLAHLVVLRRTHTQPLVAADRLDEIRVLQPGQRRELVVVLVERALLEAQLGEAGAAQRVVTAAAQVVHVHRVQRLGQGTAGEALAEALNQTFPHRGIALVQALARRHGDSGTQRISLQVLSERGRREVLGEHNVNIIILLLCVCKTSCRFALCRCLSFSECFHRAHPFYVNN